MGAYCKETVMRFRLRLFLNSLFIVVLPFPLLAWPKRIIFQLFMLPWMIEGYWLECRRAFLFEKYRASQQDLGDAFQCQSLGNRAKLQALKRGSTLLSCVYALQR